MANVLGIVGGSGLYAISALKEVERFELTTPYGSPSDVITRGRIGDATILFLPRHGRGHRFAPHTINYRANISALRQLGATHLVSISAVGSLREDVAPGHVVLVDQYIDRTHGRAGTFFDSGIVAHVTMADPVCPHLARAAAAAAARAGATVHSSGTYICIQGPQFSTRAESRLYRDWGADVIGMTALPEAKLAREAQMAYSTIALVTDYDSWHKSEAEVTVEMVLAVLGKNVELARQVILELSSDLATLPPSHAHNALENAIITDMAQSEPGARADLKWLIGEK